MTASLILVISFLTLFQFFITYSRALISRSRSHELSEQGRALCGLSIRHIAGEQFLRLEQLIALCPGPGGDEIQVRAMAVYFRLLGAVRTLATWALPSATSWIDEERSGCAGVAAMVLDRRIAYSRMMTAQQTGR
ncbi:MAG TPA: hypothetical protein VKT71_00190 [Candidatus Acidoferrales bacterium]|nr:hypothetical protein [Candidatus Acidoferrales bacterium]